MLKPQFRKKKIYDVTDARDLSEVEIAGLDLKARKVLVRKEKTVATFNIEDKGILVGFIGES